MEDRNDKYPKNKKGQRSINNSMNKSDQVVVEKGIENIALKLIDQIFEEKENRMISPFSIYVIISMILPGADGRTKQEILDVLGLKNQSLKRIYSFQKTLLSRLQTETKNDVDINIANSLWVHEKITLNHKYVQSIKRNFDGTVENINNAATINKWVDNKTKGKITHILDEMNSNVILYLINAIYFYGEWHNPFQRELTVDGKFYKKNDISVKVPFMRKRDNFLYSNMDDYEIIRLYYKGKSFYMEIILPKEGTTLLDLIKKLEESRENWQSPTEQKYGVIELPKFSVLTDMKLNDALNSVGLKQLFNPEKADLSGLSEHELNGIYVDEFKHKAVISLDEEGTEASGVSSVEVREGNPLEEQFNMNINRPFIFQIYHEKTNIIVFCGFVNDPS
ncbi:serpin family protein [Evansella sp. AB-P1]|uniref:serpin family protein n=1 Tax=Evansella sp. AB-P1 TaxID=3037653 RepID=UPI00241D3B52|nr:serpin family protein [Evansella sp. AB-P1]MDG5790083.1 serpin family protein [Evansella sp. AB-P1]